MTPKSLLRHKRCMSDISEFSKKSTFHRVLEDDAYKKINNLIILNKYNKIRKVVICSGKIYYDLIEQREKQNAILKTLGLDKKTLQRNTFLEYLSIGLFTGVLGSLLAVLITFFVEKIVFEINPKIYWEVILIGSSSSIFIIGSIATLFTIYLTAKTPKDVLRGADV